MSKAIVLQDKNGETVYPVGIGTSLQAITDLFYPVGSYYETSDISFDPNVSWYGTWVKDTTGQVTVGSGTNYTSGATGGSTTHKIASSELPTHTHTYDKSASSTGGHKLTNAELPKLSAKWTSVVPDSYQNYGSGIYSTGGQASTATNGVGNSGESGYGKPYLHQLSLGGDTAHSHGITLTSTNSGNGGFSNTAMSIMQPYIVVNRWHRTA